MIGTKLGPYEITAKLGEGGMGEVFRARDTKLERDVAIKVLPEAFSEDPERLARFEREAKLLAQLNHPNIASIYGMEESGSTRALVIELVEGPTLADRLESGPIPSMEAFSIARQIAEALEEAHEKGIVHRDLKPQNIKASAEGKVKVLDFGLAKAMDPGGGPGSAAELARSPTLMNSPTLTAAGSQLGVILGTAAYMAPEQARGLRVDRRADIWAFGVILLEMLTGRRTFEGDTVPDVLASVLAREPDLSALPPSAGPALRRVIARCLERDPRRRYHDIADVALELETAVTLDAERAEPAVPAAAPVGGRRMAWAVAALALALAAALGALLWRSGGEPAKRHVYRQLTYLPQYYTNARFGPDGQTVVFSSPPEGNRARLFVRRPEDPLPQQLGAEGTQLLAVSSQGELAVLTDTHWLYHRTYIGTLARMPLASAAPRKILEDVSAADWSPDGQELAIVRRVGLLNRLEYPPGKVLAETAGYLSDVRVSPRGDRIAYMEHFQPDDNRGRVVVVDLEGKVLVRSPESRGEEGLVWSAEGESVLFSAVFESGRYSIWSMAENGSIRELASDSQDLFVLDRAPDGRLLAVADDEQDVLVARLAGEPEERDASWLGSSVAFRLSGDGRSLLFSDQSSFSGINYAAYLLEAGGGPPLRLGEGWPLDLSPDGSLMLAVVPSEPHRLVLYPTGAGSPRDISIDGVTSYQTAEFLTDGKSVLVCGAWENRSGRCFVRKLDEGTARAVSAEGTAEGYADPSGRVALARRDDGAWVRFPLEDGTQEAVPGLTSKDVVMRVGRDAESVRVFQRATVPTRIEEVDLETGERTLVRTLGPSDLDGVFMIWFVAFSDDDSAYAYNYPRTLGQLFSIEGVQ